MKTHFVQKRFRNKRQSSTDLLIYCAVTVFPPIIPFQKNSPILLRNLRNENYCFCYGKKII